MRKADHQICSDAYYKLAARTRQDFIFGRMDDLTFKRRRENQDRIYEERWLALFRKDLPKHLQPGA